MGLLLLLVYLCLVVTHGQVLTIQPDDFYAGIVNGSFDLVIDTRTLQEWNSGHVPNATFVSSLQLETSIPQSLEDCNGACRTIVVYCRSGNRAATAANRLVESGFKGTIYNGLGVNQWTEAGYQLVNTSSVEPPCAADSNACPTIGGAGSGNNTSGNNTSGNTIGGGNYGDEETPEGVGNTTSGCGTIACGYSGETTDSGATNDRGVVSNADADGDSSGVSLTSRAALCVAAIVGVVFIL